MVESAQAVAQLLDEPLAGHVANLEVVAGLGASGRIRDEDLVVAAARTKRHYAFVHRPVAVDPDGRVGAASDAPSRGTREIAHAAGVDDRPVGRHGGSALRAPLR